MGLQIRGALPGEGEGPLNGGGERWGVILCMGIGVGVG